ncbi:unnamed protein product [Kuraishia capsulata CBS 1993]|uniref:Deacetylase sirtuin-type domain-containing protein n=1 Tax=Kuraishia capsulata CBS 1993 TaxID=1382522 RepID=W6MMQ2_9ASCO|nr:uncharacterized protein KUCA_T00003466001 [Kuraishia capsulata CBS 1993]CDK27488.1 unnamed protein product [Kuraishia capsulata CBS 1993]
MQVISLNTQDSSERIKLSSITSSVSKSRKVVVLTGAGISCNAGIPDFRSSEGLYNMVKAKHPNLVVKGKDLFDISLFRDEDTMKIFCTFMEQLYSHTICANPTETHKFLRRLMERKKLIKCYTQNIDGIERKVGMRTGTEGKWKDLDTVQLHGDLNSLACTQCFQTYSWEEKHKEMLREGEMPECPDCVAKFEERLSCGKRLASSNIGILRPNIILYGENHPHAESIARGIQQDANRAPNLLLIFGTSLKVDGVKKLVRTMAKKIHEKENGLVIFINQTQISTSSWDGIIDYQIQADCDEWIINLKKEIPDLFLTQAQLDLKKQKKVKEQDYSIAALTPPSTPKHKDRYLNLILNTPSPKKSKPVSIFSDSEYPITASSPRRTPRKTRLINDKENVERISPPFSPIAKMSPFKKPELASPEFSPLKKCQSPSKKRKLAQEVELEENNVFMKRTRSTRSLSPAR